MAKEKIIPNFSIRWDCTHPNLKGFDYKWQMNRKIAAVKPITQTKTVPCA